MGLGKAAWFHVCQWIRGDVKREAGTVSSHPNSQGAAAPCSGTFHCDRNKLGGRTGVGEGLGFQVGSVKLESPSYNQAGLSSRRLHKKSVLREFGDEDECRSHQCLD